MVVAAVGAGDATAAAVVVAMAGSVTAAGVLLAAVVVAIAGAGAGAGDVVTAAVVLADSVANRLARSSGSS